MANEENLELMMGKNRGLSTEEARKIGSKGGKASGEARRLKKTYAEIANEIMSLPVTDENTKAFIESMGYNGEITMKVLEVVSMHQEVLKGNVKAFELLRDTTGEKPIDKLAIEEAPQIVLKRPEK